jgi:2-polyprenyl-6-methoxyphenol hydroxylase-like FAD-dependent oxidoreductase
MSGRIGKQAVVVGAGMAGLTAARSLADSFEKIVVLENDTLPKEAIHRPGTPQCRHLHALLPGGLQALIRLFPGFEDSLSQAGAVHLRMGYDNWRELPGYDPFPLRDFGISVYSMTRPVLEYTVRKRIGEYGNIEIRENCRVIEFITSGGEATAIGVRFENAGGQIETLPADLVIDASGHGSFTLALLNSLGLPVPEETSIGVDFGYATALFDIPRDRPPGWMGVFTFPSYPHNRRGGAIFPVEGNRWIVALAGRYEDKPPADWHGYLAFAERLRTATVYNAIRGAHRPTEIVRFGFKASRWRHFERLDHFPLGMLPFGDAICRFNPIYGQGMSVAALEAEILRRLLTEQSTEGNRLANLAERFFAEATSLIDTPWWAAAIPDFIDPRTEGERPPDLENTLKFSAALLKLAAEDPAVHRLFLEVQSLLKLRSAYRDAKLMQRVKAAMAAA